MANQAATIHTAPDPSPWNDNLTAALFYAGLGWHVFPLKEKDKRPDTPRGFKDATTDGVTIRCWWSEKPSANIGIACGASGLVVVDTDVKNGIDGQENWHELLEQLGARYDKSVTVETPTGGEHIYFRSSGSRIKSSASRLAPGIDVRAAGGYVVAPPSIHPQGGAYQWALGCEPGNIELLPFPAQLEERLKKATGKTEKQRELGPIPQGTRNITLASMAGSMRACGFDIKAIEAALKVQNEKSCDPPLKEREVKSIARSMARYQPNLPFNSLFSTSGFLAHTLHLDTSQVGGYLLLLIHYWSHGKGPETNQREIQLITRWDAKGYGRKAAKVLELFEVRDGRLYHHELEKELQKAKKKSEGAKRAANARWKKSNANAMP